ncbi:MAG: hypothetical protein ACR2QM_04600 [Longimicrobiales bacterium]
MKRFSILPLLAALAACGEDSTGPICTSDVRAGLAVEVVDATTGASLAPGALVWARSGSFTDTLRFHGPPDEYRGAEERPGVYTVVAEHTDYVRWRRDFVIVTADECHVVTRELRAELALDRIVATASAKSD